MFVEENKHKRVWDTYVKNEKAGSGVFGVVWQVLHHDTGDERVMKIIDKTQVKTMPSEEIKLEVVTLA